MRWVVRGVVGLAGAAMFWLLAVWPPPVWFRSHWPAETAFMGMRRHEARATPLPDRRYRPVPLDSMSRYLPVAAMIGEDNRFYEHSGLDYYAIRHTLGYRGERFSWTQSADRAELWRVLSRSWARRDRLRGASTITQQLAKNLYLSPSRNPLRKVKEAVTAYRLEAALGKRRILELYLNVVELGDNVWGVEAASQRYFGRPALRLTPEQAAALAGSLPFPLRSNPGYRPGRMRWRQDLILRRMRGEDVEVPREEDLPDAPEVEPIIPVIPADSVVVQLDSVPAVDSAISQASPDSAPPERQSPP